MEDHQILLISFIFFVCVSISSLSTIKAQQNYSRNSVMDCDKNDETTPSPDFLYTCNGKRQSCQSFLIFKSQFPYNTVTSISNLTSSNPSKLAQINHISSFTQVLPQDREVIVPVTCSCSGQYYQANTSFIIPSVDDTYFSIANDTYQGLTTCNILMSKNNNYSALNLYPGLVLQVPLRCACPTSNQTASGVKFLLTYLVSWGDNVPDISMRFNVSVESVVSANGFTENDPMLYPFTTILIPLSNEPLSSQTIIHYPPPPTSSPFIPIHKHTNSNRRSRKGLVFWIGVGITLVILSFVMSIVLLHYKKKGDEAARKAGEGKKKWDLPKDFLVNQGLKFYNYEELSVATEDFSSTIAGSVYRGVLNGEDVAIKKMSKSVSKEVNLLKKINHFNLIGLRGACEHNGVFYLLYEFMETGSLRDWLQEKRRAESESLNLRVHIGLDIAHGLHYLHNFTDTGYVHKDISSDNVLLDKDLRAKIANFSLARSSVREETNSSVKNDLGTKGYMAPEYVAYGLVTPEMDTYALGVVLLELITGREAVYMHDGEEVLLAEAVFSIMEGGTSKAKLEYWLIDPSLQAKNQMELALRVIKLSLACLVQEPESRPSMAEVVSSLLKIQLDVQRSEPFFWHGSIV